MAMSLSAALLSAAVVLGACGIAQSAKDTSEDPSSQVVVGHSTPSEQYDSVDSAIRASDGVILGSVVAVAPGRSVIAGGITMPFTNVTLRVMESSVGAIPVNSTIVIEQTGGQTPRGVLVGEDDPLYQTNEVDVLILRKIDIGYRSIAPLGRFRVQGGQLQPTAPTSIARTWSGRSPGDLMSSAKQLQAGK
ncbi:MAG: hypothetical protein HYX56_05590 [Chloroflexi bacterium]|nr:hypothetical protein [Chloroflexota bacterium]